MDEYFSPRKIIGEEAQTIFNQIEYEFNNLSYTLFDLTISTIDKITKTNLPTKNSIFI
jgi:hypothetical protein